MKRQIVLAQLVALAVFGSVSQLSAAMLAMTAPGTSTNVFSPGLGGSPGYTAGFRFTVGDQALSVTSLGLYDIDEDGLEGTARVAIWDLDGNQLSGALATVPAGTGADQFDGGFRFQDLASPVILAANESYVIGFEALNVSFRGSEELPSAFLAPTFSTPHVTFFERRLTDGAIGFAYPAVLGAQPGNYTAWEANFLFNPVPEPASGSMMLSALVGMWLFRRKLRRGC